MLANKQSSLVISNRYCVRLAETEEELRAAQNLRYRVFNLELGEGLDTSCDSQLDSDPFDAQCNHLLVVERDSNEIIGTYRMQDYQQASKHCGFYSEKEFDLSVIPRTIREQSVEVGRACIHKEHRNGRVLYLLWRGIAEFIKLKSARYLFGCCSINSTDPARGWQVMEYLRRQGHTHETFEAQPNPDFGCPRPAELSTRAEEVELPQLFRLYLDLGARVLSAPALDSQFKTIDYLVMVDIETLSEQTRTLFFK